MAGRVFSGRRTSRDGIGGDTSEAGASIIVSPYAAVMSIEGRPMPPHFDDEQRLETLADRLVDSYYADPRTQHLDSTFLPNRQKAIEAVDLLRMLLFPGFFEQERLTSANIGPLTRNRVRQIRDLLYDQARQSLRHAANCDVRGVSGDQTQREACERCDEQAAHIVDAFLERLPETRRLLALDVQAAFEGDPAAVHTDEVIFCYPGLTAVFVYRIAHEFYRMGVPLLARLMSEYAHSTTGIEIHPGAKIGESFFIDHGAGVVIGETTVIGNRVKIYQGVTLGALSTKGGQAWRGRKRHPTIEDDVTIYGGAIILGGDTIIGRGSTIGGSVFLTSSVPPHHTVGMKPPELRLQARPQKAVERDEALRRQSPAGAAE